ncbi:MAG TPA: phosphate-starvation-inducible PsiE family protein [Pseudolabrys sp.]|nr:phosphate-starvation-inducible PsiE family protein [Pseudolabrys sp.]
MLNIAILKRQWKDLTSYERFEQVVSRIVMLLIAVVIVYALILVAVNLFEHFKLGLAFMNAELLQDVFGPILTILILIEFNHSIAVALTRKSGILHARTVVLIAVLVIARKVILLDFKSASLETFAGIAAIAVAFGALYWLIGARSLEAAPTSESHHQS